MKTKEDPQEIVKFINEKVYGANQETKKLYTKSWYVNLAYLLGQTDLVWFQDRLQKAPFKKDYITSNILIQPFRSLKARYLRFIVNPNVIPENNEKEAVETARIGTKILQILWRDLLLKEKLNELVWWFLSVGTAFLKVFWDNNIGEGYFDEEKKVSWKKGDVGIDVITPFNIALYPSVISNEEDLRGICHYRIVHIDEVKRVYDKEIEPGEDITIDDFYFSRVLGNKITYVPSRDYILLKEYWERESSEYPKGRYIVVAGNELLENRTNDFIEVPNYKIWSPLVKFTSFNVGGSYWGISPIEQCKTHQKIYNRIFNLILKNAFLMGSIKWLVPRGSNLEETALNTLVGEIVEYDPVGIMPTQSSPTPIPNYILVLLDRVKYEIEGIFAQHDIKYPLRVRTATEISLTQQSDEDVLTPEIQSYLTSLEKVGQLILFIASREYLEEREFEGIKIAGKDLKRWKNVYMEAPVNLPDNKIVRQQVILDYYKEGLLGDPGDDRTRKRVLKLLEFGNVDNIFKEEEEEEVGKEEEEIPKELREVM